VAELARSPSRAALYFPSQRKASLYLPNVRYLSRKNLLLELVALPGPAERKRTRALVLRRGARGILFVNSCKDFGGGQRVLDARPAPDNLYAEDAVVRLDSDESLGQSPQQDLRKGVSSGQPPIQTDRKNCPSGDTVRGCESGWARSDSAQFSTGTFSI
jgi:hypothetical protein